MENSPLWSAMLVSLRTAALSIVATFFLGLFAARRVAAMRRRRWQSLIDAVLILPLVLPPTVVGFFLLLVFGANRPVGRFFLEFFGYRIAFSPAAAVLAAVAVSFPLMYRAARGALEQVDPDILDAARTLGMSERRIFWRVALPTALPGVAAGTALAFARGLGEFGATAMIAGNIAGRTRTLPLAVYSATAAGDMDSAYRYVFAIVAVSLLAAAGMSYFLAKDRRNRAGGRGT